MIHNIEGNSVWIKLVPKTLFFLIWHLRLVFLAVTYLNETQFSSHDCCYVTASQCLAIFTLLNLTQYDILGMFIKHWAILYRQELFLCQFKVSLDS